MKLDTNGLLINITYKDIADMWIHESFTRYSENLYLDYHFGKEASSEYVIGTQDIAYLIKIQ